MGRKSAGQKRNEAFTPASIDFEMLSKNFHRPLKEVSKDLGVCSTMLKKICRNFGIKRWPHRKIRSLNRMIRSLEATVVGSPEEAQQVQQEIGLLQSKVQSLIKQGSLAEDDMKSEPSSPQQSSGEPSPVISRPSQQVQHHQPQQLSQQLQHQHQQLQQHLQQHQQLQHQQQQQLAAAAAALPAALGGPSTAPQQQPTSMMGPTPGGVPLGPSPFEPRAADSLNVPRGSDSLTLLLQAGAYDSDWVDAVRQWAVPAPLGDALHPSTSTEMRFFGGPFRSPSGDLLGISRSLDLAKGLDLSKSMDLDSFRRPSFDTSQMNGPPMLSESMLYVPGSSGPDPRKGAAADLGDLAASARSMSGSSSISDMSAGGSPVTLSSSLPTLPMSGGHAAVKSESMSSFGSAGSQQQHQHRVRGKKRNALGELRGASGPDARSPPFTDPRAGDLRSAAAAADPRAAQILARFGAGLTPSSSGREPSPQASLGSDSGGRPASDSAALRPFDRTGSGSSSSDSGSPLNSLIEGSPSLSGPSLPQPVLSSTSFGSLLAGAPMRSASGFPPVFSGSWPRPSLSSDGLFSDALEPKFPLYPSESPSGEQFFPDPGARPAGLSMSDSLGGGLGKPGGGGGADKSSAGTAPATRTRDGGTDNRPSPERRDRPSATGPGGADGNRTAAESRPQQQQQQQQAQAKEAGVAGTRAAEARDGAAASLVSAAQALQAHRQQYLMHAVPGMQQHPQQAYSGFPYGMPFAPFLPPNAGMAPADAYRSYPPFFQQMHPPSAPPATAASSFSQASSPAAASSSSTGGAAAGGSNPLPGLQSVFGRLVTDRPRQLYTPPEQAGFLASRFPR